MLTKPAGVFVQIVGGLVLIVGVLMLTDLSHGMLGTALTATGAGVGLLWMGRATRR